MDPPDPVEPAPSEEEVRLGGLIERARAGERAAQEQLMAYYRPRLRRWAASRLAGSTVDPSSMTQDVLTRLFRGLPSFRGSTPRQLKAWLSTALNHLIASSRRGRATQKRSGGGLAALPQDESPTPSRHLRDRQGQWRLRQLISRLPRDQGHALWLRHYEGHSVAEIAARLSRTGPQVSNLLWRAEQSLRQQVDGDGEPVLPEEEERLAPLIDRAMADYTERRDAGEAIDREAFLAAHPACAAVLRRILEWADRVMEWSRE